MNVGHSFWADDLLLGRGHYGRSVIRGQERRPQPKRGTLSSGCMQLLLC